MRPATRLHNIPHGYTVYSGIEYTGHAGPDAPGVAMQAGLDINLLRVLVALDERRSVSLAAKALRRSQPSISAALARLRHQLDDPLFLRSGTAMVPTPRAASIIDAARDALDVVDRRIVPPAAFEAAASKLPVRLALSDVGEIVFLPKVLALLRERMPLAPVHSLSPLADVVGRELEYGHVDLAIGYFPDLSGHSYSQQVLFTDTYACLIRADHPIRADRLTIEQFRQAQHAVVRAESRTEEVMERFLAQRGIERRVALATPHFASVPLLVAQSDLIVTVPDPLARHFASMASNLRIIGLPFKPPAIALKQFWHRRYQHDARNQWLRSHVFRLFEERRRN